MSPVHSPTPPRVRPGGRHSRFKRWFLWVPALAIAFYLGSASRETLSRNIDDGGSNSRSAVGAVSADDSSELSPDERSTVALFKEASPAVVYITTVEPRRLRYTRTVTETPTGSGSGFIWDDNGHVVTNYHVIRSVWDERTWTMMRGDRVTVTLADQSEWNATVLGVAPEKDLAVLHIDAPKEKLRVLRRGFSANLQVGQSVLAIGNPFGLDRTLTTGVVSALDREIGSVNPGRIIRNVIQTDAAINPGNSGGPLLDSRGRLIGVNTQIASTSGSSAGIGFAIPVDTVSWVVPDLIQFGMVNRPTLGLSNIDDQYIRRLGKRGVLVLGVTPGSGAAKAGVRGTVLDERNMIRQLGDVITKVAGEQVQNFDDLLRTLEDQKEGDLVELELLRDDKAVKVRVELGPGEAQSFRRNRR